MSFPLLAEPVQRPGPYSATAGGAERHDVGPATAEGMEGITGFSRIALGDDMFCSALNHGYC